MSERAHRRDAIIEDLTEQARSLTAEDYATLAPVVLRQLDRQDLVVMAAKLIYERAGT